jgi:deazaflavin-dependent oxidoreductase (nitroreductase family)
MEISMTTIAYRRPSRLRTTFYKVVNPLLRFLVLRFGFQSHGEQDAMRILRVRGRKSGKLYETPVRLATFERGRYILSLLGESQWVRNLRTVGTAELIAGGTVELIHAREIQDQEKIAFLTWYCQHPMYMSRVRYGLGVNTKRLTSEEIDHLAGLYPVFRVESTPETRAF